MTKLSTTVIWPTYSTTKMSLYTKQNIQIGDIHEYVQYAINAMPLIAYIIRKNNWSYEQLLLIYWDDLEAALKGYKPFYRTKIAQLSLKKIQTSALHNAAKVKQSNIT